MSQKPPETPLDGWDGLDRTLRHPVRLAVCVLLSRHDALTFSRLKAVLGETDGSLGAHLRKLEDARYLSLRKALEGRRPVTWYALTRRGRSALTTHLDGLDRLIRQAR
ncbi:MAG: transcriptional regulator [Planctomycetota bacterium]